MDGELPRREDLGIVFDELDHQMACQAYLWALPLVSYAQWKTQHYDVFGATASDLVQYLSYRDRLGLITANATTPYILNFFDLSETGPLVIELPPGPTAGGMSDFWQREFAVLGEMGPDAGHGGRHVVVPPGQDAPAVEDGYYVHRATGVNMMFGFRTLDPDPERARKLVEAVRIYPYADREDPPPPASSPRPAGRGPATSRAASTTGSGCTASTRPRSSTSVTASTWPCSSSSGIEKGKPFDPDDRLSTLLSRASAAGELMAQVNTFAKRFEGSRYWPDRQWDLAIVLDNSAQRGRNYDELLERASWFYEAVSFSEAMKSQTPGAGQAYLGTYTDADGAWLDGARSYRLHVPANPPAKLFWSATVYDVSTRCLIDNEQQRGDRGSRDPDVMRNDDGSVDLYFGPTAPAGRESNWVQTIPGRHWFSLLPPLRSAGAVLRPLLEARRHHPRLTRPDAYPERPLIASPMSLAPMIRQRTDMMTALCAVIQSFSPASSFSDRSPIAK